MCRLYGFRANEPTKVECSLVFSQNGLLAQSRADRRGESHPDGWGMAFYENGDPEVQRRTTAAYDCVHFSVTAERMYARTVVAHVRKATVGPPSLVNTHPFTYRHWVFAHNGTIRAFDKTGPLMVAETDPALLEFRRGSERRRRLERSLHGHGLDGGRLARGRTLSRHQMSPGRRRQAGQAQFSVDRWHRADGFTVPEHVVLASPGRNS
jgi:predicted glutamine amidotransferase